MAASPRQQLLTKLTDLDVDVMCQIMSHAEPPSLFNLAQTSVAFRKILTNPSWKFVWRAARSNARNMPDCPSDLTELQYAGLAFIRRCDICSKNLRATALVYIDWSNRLRTCQACLKEHYDKIPDSIPRDCRKHDFLVDWTPMMKNVRIGSKRPRDFYLRRIPDQWKREYARIPDANSKAAWGTQKINERIAVEKHALECRLWHIRFTREVDHVDVVSERKAMVLARVKSLGWEEEIDKIPPAQERPEELAVVHRKCQSDLTESVLSELEPRLIQHMKGVQTSHLLSEKVRILQTRKPIFEQLRYDIAKYFGIYIPISELYRISIESPHKFDFSTPYPGAIVVPGYDILEQWRTHIEGKLLRMIIEILPIMHYLDLANVVPLATSFFDCSRCAGRYPLTYTQAMVHKCALLPINANVDRDQHAVGEALGQSQWNSNYTISFNSSTVSIVHSMLGMYNRGFEFRVPKANTMDGLNVIFECLLCNDPDSGRATMGWRAVAPHYRKMHRGNALKIEILPPHEAEKALSIMRHTESIWMRSSDINPSFICPYASTCPYLLPGAKMNHRTLLTHLRENHEVYSPTKEHFIWVPDRNRVVEVYRLWPPRPRAGEFYFDSLALQNQGHLA